MQWRSVPSDGPDCGVGAGATGAVEIALAVDSCCGGGGGSGGGGCGGRGGGGGGTLMVCNAACMAAATSCLSKVTGTVCGGGVGEVVGRWRGLGQCDSGGSIPFGHYHGGKDS